MTNTNTFSDSQESAIIDEETYNAIEKDFGGQLPVTMNDDILAASSQTLKEDDLSSFNIANLPSFESDEPVAKRFKEEKEEEDDYYPPMNTLPQYFDDAESGMLNFQYEIIETSQDWVYSPVVRKLYMKMDKSLPLQFTWNQPLPGVYLRAMMAFKPEQYKNDPVMRCLNHMAASNPVNQNMDPEKIKHVVHCVTHDHCTRYDETNGFLSTITKLGAPKLTRQGLQYEKMCFKFTCTNSCTGGMNRRHTELIFTLENARGKVLDCAKLSIRVCCCPKRDKRRDEKGLPMEDGPSNGDNAMPLAKMPSEHIYNVQLSIPGKENYLSVLKYAYDVMAGQAFKTGQHDFFKPYMEDILHKTA